MMGRAGILSHDYACRAPVERLVEHLQRLGPRALAEFLDALSIEHGIGAAIVAKLEEYRRIHPLALSVTRGDRFAPPPMRRMHR